MQMLHYAEKRGLRERRYAGTDNILSMLRRSAVSFDTTARDLPSVIGENIDRDHKDYASIFSMTTFVNG